MNLVVPGSSDQALDTESIEHLVRKEDGGTNALDNLALAHRGCNKGRGDINWFVYKSYVMDMKKLNGIAA